MKADLIGAYQIIDFVNIQFKPHGLEFEMETLFAWRAQLNFPMTKNMNAVWISAKSAVRQWVRQYRDCIVEIYGAEDPVRPSDLQCEPDQTPKE